ncbi:MAG: DUF1963 domain-containing protein, partial [Campylobacterales bacterium]|nr:DUF1963 domain-containing protein [Campylobacterales bacterium]
MSVDEFINTLNKNNLNELATTFLKHKKSAIKINLKADDDVTLGDSKFGGNPHLPSDFEWPLNDEGIPLPCLAQFNLAQLPPNNLIHNQGMLYFFYDIVKLPWGFEEDYKSFAVCYSNTKVDELEIVPTPEEAYGDFMPFEQRKIAFEITESLPSLESDLIDLSSSPENAFDILYDLKELFPEAPRHQMFGHPYIVQNDGMDEDSKECVGEYFPEVLESNEPWYLLFQ